MFTYRSKRSGITSKAPLARINPLLAGIRPMTEGRMFAPKIAYYQSAGHMDLLIKDIAAIMHPELFPEHEIVYFQQLAER